MLKFSEHSQPRSHSSGASSRRRIVQPQYPNPTTNVVSRRKGSQSHLDPNSTTHIKVIGGGAEESPQVVAPSPQRHHREANNRNTRPTMDFISQKDVTRSYLDEAVPRRGHTSVHQPEPQHRLAAQAALAAAQQQVQQQRYPHLYESSSNPNDDGVGSRRHAKQFDSGNNFAERILTQGFPEKRVQATPLMSARRIVHQQPPPVSAHPSPSCQSSRASSVGASRRHGGCRNSTSIGLIAALQPEEGKKPNAQQQQSSRFTLETNSIAQNNNNTSTPRFHGLAGAARRTTNHPEDHKNILACGHQPYVAAGGGHENGCRAGDDVYQEEVCNDLVESEIVPSAPTSPVRRRGRAEYSHLGKQEVAGDIDSKQAQRNWQQHPSFAHRPHDHVILRDEYDDGPNNNNNNTAENDAGDWATSPERRRRYVEHWGEACLPPYDGAHDGPQGVMPSPRRNSRSPPRPSYTRRREYPDGQNNNNNNNLQAQYHYQQPNNAMSEVRVIVGHGRARPVYL
eukprot:PhM_4_TR3255/c0_g2_i1/m.7080